MAENQWKADPDKYARLAEAFEDEEHARVAVSAFMGEFSTLREKYSIPELVVQYQVYVLRDGERMVMHGGMGFGNQAEQAELAKRAFDQEFEHLCLIVHTLAAKMPKVRNELLTDPENNVEGE